MDAEICEECGEERRTCEDHGDPCAWLYCPCEQVDAPKKAVDSIGSWPLSLFEKMARAVQAETELDRVKAQYDLLDAYAEYLASKIRHSTTLRDYTDDHMGDCEAAADFIDPKQD